MEFMMRLVFMLVYGAIGSGDSQEKTPVGISPSVVSEFSEQNPKASNITVLLDAPIGDRNLFVVCGTELRHPYRSRHDRLFLLPTDLFGVYLKRRNISRPTKLVLEQAGGEGFDLQVAHFDSSEVVFRKFDSVGRSLKNLKLFFDPETANLLSRLEYEPFKVTRILVEKGIPYFVAGDTKQTLILRPSENPDGFIIETEGEARRLLSSLQFYSWTTPGESFRFVLPERHPVRRFGPRGRFVLEEESSTGKYASITESTPEGTLAFELPQSTWDEFERLRPERVRDGYRRNEATIEEEFGPSQVVGNRLWFGKSHADSEGITGIGGFGYFDCETRRFVIYSPLEIRNSSVTSILITGQEAWLAATSGGERSGSPNALLRWSMTERQVQSRPLDDLAHAMAEYRGDLYLATDAGIEVLKKQGFRRYLIDITRDGKYSVAMR